MSYRTVLFGTAAIMALASGGVVRAGDMAEPGQEPSVVVDGADFVGGDAGIEVMPVAVDEPYSDTDGYDATDANDAGDATDQGDGTDTDGGDSGVTDGGTDVGVVTDNGEDWRDIDIAIDPVPEVPDVVDPLPDDVLPPPDGTDGVDVEYMAGGGGVGGAGGGGPVLDDPIAQSGGPVANAGGSDGESGCVDRWVAGVRVCE